LHHWNDASLSRISQGVFNNFPGASFRREMQMMLKLNSMGHHLNSSGKGISLKGRLPIPLHPES